MIDKKTCLLDLDETLISVSANNPKGVLCVYSYIDDEQCKRNVRSYSLHSYT